MHQLDVDPRKPVALAALPFATVACCAAGDRGRIEFALVSRCYRAADLRHD